ncbi:MAG TPA: phosphoribosyltransferase family protein [Gaiellaceae bacterium]|nr:phosphoribosyltransferase family protein [Gaiellaceae bacterium]
METSWAESTGFLPHVTATPTLYVDRVDAGRELAARLAGEATSDTVVVALSHGGVEVAAEVARELGAPLDMLVVRKIRYPGSPERVLGAVAPGYATYVHTAADLTHRRLAIAIADARDELEHVESRLHADRRPLQVRDRSVLLVDDGITTGARMVTGTRWARTQRARRVVAAAPVASARGAELVRAEADHVVCPHELASLGAVGIWYEELEPLTDEDVLHLLDAADRRIGRVREETHMSAVHVRFVRPGDADAAFAELGDHGLRRACTLHPAELEVACRIGEEDDVIREVEHALDDWFEERHLPFTPELTGPHTIVVRPPAD